jgi:formylglycine-generating enzyme required for sulfatase activity
MFRGCSASAAAASKCRLPLSRVQPKPARGIQRMDFIKIPDGVLLMGDTRLRDAAPPHKLALRAFAIGKYPVTNAEYAEFIAARGYETEAYWTAMGWKWMRGRIGQQAAPAFWNEPRLNQARYPVVGVSWYEAVAFCNWLSARDNARYRLPSEAEWEYAARGANHARNFPWGENFERGRANTAEAGFGGTTPVSHFPTGVSPFGVWDMAGNVFEWTLSKWGSSWQELEFVYPYRAEDGRENMEGSGARVMRGGSWFTLSQEASCAYRSRYLAGSRASNIGFRVVKE